MLINSQDEIDASSNCGFAVVRSQCVTCVVNRIYGRTAGGIDREADIQALGPAVTLKDRPVLDVPWTLQIERIADSIADDSWIDTRGSIIMAKIGVSDRHLLVIAGERPNKDRRIASRDTVKCQAC